MTDLPLTPIGTSYATGHHTSRRSTFRRFARSPKGQLTFVLVGLVVVALMSPDLTALRTGLLLNVTVSLLVAAAIDVPILRWRDGEWQFPSGALLTALLVAMVLSPLDPWYVAAATSAVGVLSKYALRTRSANVFNPAALALVATFYLFDTGQSWWGALPELPLPAIVLLLGSGVFITDRVNKLPLVLSLLGTYFLLASIVAFAGSPTGVAELFRAPDLHAVLFFAFFMATDPPTSPPKHRDQLMYGVITAAAGFAVFEFIGAAYFLLAGLLVANVWEGWRRSRMHALRTKRHVVTTA